MNNPSYLQMCLEQVERKTESTSHTWSVIDSDIGYDVMMDGVSVGHREIMSRAQNRFGRQANCWQWHQLVAFWILSEEIGSILAEYHFVALSSHIIDVSAMQGYCRIDSCELMTWLLSLHG